VSITVYLFAVLAEKVGKRQLRMELARETRAGLVLDRLADDYPSIAEFRNVIRVAVNREYVGEDFVVRDGDELALITPTSGG
jgi:molybdopterin converting factor subunit 1